MSGLFLRQPPLGIALRRWRTLHRIKQARAAELFAVNQSTISRWEAGVQEMSPGERARVEKLLQARIIVAPAVRRNPQDDRCRYP